MKVERHEVGPRMSKAVVHGDTVYLAGQVASDTGADVTGQTRQVLASIDALLAEAGTDKSRILSATIYLKDIAAFGAMNQVWEAWVDPANTQARTTLEATLAGPDYLVEITVVAAR